MESPWSTVLVTPRRDERWRLHGSRQPRDVGGGNRDAAAETRVQTDVFEVFGLGRVGVQLGFDPLPIGRVHEVQLLRPDGLRFLDQRLAVRIPGIGSHNDRSVLNIRYCCVTLYTLPARLSSQSGPIPGEGDHLVDRLGPGGQHHQAVESQAQPTAGGRPCSMAASRRLSSGRAALPSPRRSSFARALRRRNSPASSSS